MTSSNQREFKRRLGDGGMLFKGLVLAAGMSKRMGSFKPLMKVNEHTLIENSIHSLLEAQVEHIVLVVGYRGEEIEALFDQQKSIREKLTIVYNPYYEQSEMLDSVKIGLSYLDKCDGFFLLPGDMPAVSKNTFVQLKKAFKSGSIVFPTIENHRKHPPLIGDSYKDEILKYQSNQGLRGFWELKRENIVEIPVLDKGCDLDMDTKTQFDNLCRYMTQKGSYCL